MNFNLTNTLCGCNPKQIVNFNLAINSEDISNIRIYNDCNNEYDMSSLEYAYSLDNVCWSCYISYNDIILNTIDIQQDLYLRLKVPGTVSSVKINCCDYTNYSTQLDAAFNFSYCNSNITSNMYNPYMNMGGAVDLQRGLSDLVCCMFGIDIYYFRLNPEGNSKDITFKEYTLMNVEPPKQIKLMIADGQMPSSKPEFNDFGLDFQTDWETEISKTTFATAFGNEAQPMEGDFIWIPMMKRMWQVSGAYEEKKDSLMWNATTFKVALIKYEEKGSVNLGDMSDMVNSFITNKYDDLFGDDEDIMGSGEQSVEAPLSAADNLYPIFKSDATRKYVPTTGLNIYSESTYYKGTLISDSWYTFDTVLPDQKIVYQKQYCGDDLSISFIINPYIIQQNYGIYTNKLLSIGDLYINIEQAGTKTTLSVNKDSKLTLDLISGNTYFVVIRWSKDLKISEISSILYTYNQNIPIYKLQSGHYYYNVDNRETVSSKWNIEYTISKKTDIELYNFNGRITNIKIFSNYNDDLSEMLQQYPTNNYLIVNDTARKLVGLDGVKIR